MRNARTSPTPSRAPNSAMAALVAANCSAVSSGSMDAAYRCSVLCSDGTGSGGRAACSNKSSGGDGDCDGSKRVSVRAKRMMMRCQFIGLNKKNKIYKKKGKKFFYLKEKKKLYL